MTLKMQMRLVTAIIMFFIMCAFDSASAFFSVDFTDVGAGDCIIVHAEDQVMMIDTGPGRAWSAVDGILSGHSVDRIDLLVLTHSHPDHTANLDRILSSRTVSKVMFSYADKDAFAEYDAVLTASGIETGVLRRGDHFDIGNVSCDVLWPIETAAELINDRSIVMRLTCHGFSVLLMGDAESETERYLLAISDPAELKADMIKLGHHGMSTSSTWPFISSVSPTYAIVSCAGPDHNSSLSPIVRDTLDECGVPYVLTTAGCGTIHLEINDDGILTIR